MTDYLVFRLYAPLASWGQPAVGESRPSASHPGRGAILGLLAAALGLPRDAADGLAALTDSVRVGVKQLNAGQLMRDYHTVQVPSSERKVRHFTRRDELNRPTHELNTVLSSRDYRSDGCWVVAIWLTSQATLGLEQIEAALKRPRFTLYLGRKACPLAVPVAPIRKSFANLKQALDVEFPPLFGNDNRRWRTDPKSDSVVLYCWEGDADGLDGGDDVESSDVWDQPINRQRWQFGKRTEYRRYQSSSEAG